jgi:hypothetical protein
MSSAMSPGKLSGVRIDEKINEPIAEVRTEDVESSPPRNLGKDRAITPSNKKFIVSRTTNSISKVDEEN